MIETPNYTNRFFGTRFNFGYILKYDFHNGIDDLLTLTEALNQGGVIDALKRDSLFNDPYQYINNIRIYPFDLTKVFETLKTDKVNLGGASIPLNCSYISPSNPVNANNAYVFDMGKITYKHDAEVSFKDFEPYTTYTLYLPYYGFIDIEAKAIINHELSIKYIVNFNDGKCNIVLSVKDLTGDYVYKTLDCVIGYELPIGSTNASAQARNKMNAILGGITGIMSSGGDVSKIGTAITGGGTKLLNSHAISYQKGTFNGDIGGWFTPQQPILIIHKAQFFKPMRYKDLVGEPCEQTILLSQLEKDTYFKVKEVKLTGFAQAKENERDELETLLKGGVYY